MGLRSPPPRKTFVRTQQCTTLLNLFLRSPYVTAEFQSDNAPGLLIYSILVDFSGNAALITPLNPYINYFLMLFIAAFLLACWLGSLGTWLLKIRIVTLVGSKLGILQFAARSAIIMIVFAPLLFVFSYPWLSIGSTFILAMTLLFPWFKGNFKYRRGLQDVLAGTMVVRA